VSGDGVEHVLTLTDGELRDLYSLLKHADTDYLPGADAVWERLCDLWSTHLERINAATRGDEVCPHGLAWSGNCIACHPEKFPPHGSRAKYDQGCRCNDCEPFEYDDRRTERSDG
jgi:hypothetical protein